MLTFKDIKQNYPVYILDKQELTVITGKATTVSFPRIDTNQPGQMFVDVTIEADGKSAIYAIPGSLSITYAGNLVLSTDQDSLSKEIEAMKNAAEQALAQVDHQKQIVEKASSLLAELNPIYKEKAQTEARLKAMESSIKDMKELLTNFVNKFES